MGEKRQWTYLDGFCIHAIKRRRAALDELVPSIIDAANFPFMCHTRERREKVGVAEGGLDLDALL